MKKTDWTEKITTICLYILLFSCVAMLGFVIIFCILTFLGSF